MKRKPSEIRTIMEYEFLRGTTALQPALNINSLFDCSITTQQTVSNWRAKFHTDNLELTHEPRDRPESRVHNDELKVIADSDQSQTAYKLSLKFG